MILIFYAYFLCNKMTRKDKNTYYFFKIPYLLPCIATHVAITELLSESHLVYNCSKKRSENLKSQISLFYFFWDIILLHLIRNLQYTPA